jgi:hypothetical protein
MDLHDASRRLPLRWQPRSVSEECRANKGDVTVGTVQKPAKDEEIRKLIAARAYELWESHGRPRGCDLINWQQAEQEIMSSLERQQRSVSSEAAKAGSRKVDR